LTGSLELSGMKRGAGLKFQVIVGHEVIKRRVLFCDSDKKWRYADASSENTMPASALTLSRVRENTRGKILFTGLINDISWNWTPKQPLYVSTIPGLLTQTVPNESGNLVQCVGVALTETLILFSPNYVMVEVA